MWPIPGDAVAFLSESVAPWPCATFLRIQVGASIELEMPVESAAPILAALSAMAASAFADAEAIR